MEQPLSTDIIFIFCTYETEISIEAYGAKFVHQHMKCTSTLSVEAINELVLKRSINLFLKFSSVQFMAQLCRNEDINQTAQTQQYYISQKINKKNLTGYDVRFTDLAIRLTQNKMQIS